MPQANRDRVSQVSMGPITLLVTGSGGLGHLVVAMFDRADPFRTTEPRGRALGLGCEALGG
jgi:hypothetical protein